MRSLVAHCTVAFLAAIAAVPAFLAPAPASAQTSMCAAHDKMGEALAQKFGEKRQVIGLVGGSGLMEIYVSPTGTWTMVMTDPRKLSCILAAGHSWDQMPPAKELTGLVH
ncbi:MAG: hypothetical protein AB7E66_03240 [Parvibaculaceae bacterium]